MNSEIGYILYKDMSIYRLNNHKKAPTKYCIAMKTKTSASVNQVAIAGGEIVCRILSAENPKERDMWIASINKAKVVPLFSSLFSSLFSFLFLFSLFSLFSFLFFSFFLFFFFFFFFVLFFVFGFLSFFLFCFVLFCFLF